MSRDFYELIADRCHRLIHDLICSLEYYKKYAPATKNPD